MKSFFTKRFEEEVLSNEKLRTTILACIFLAAVVYTVINMLVFDDAATDPAQKESLRMILVFHISLFLFEMLSWLYIKRKIKLNEFIIPLSGRYLNSLIEISSPGIIILLLAKQYDTPSSILHAPVAYIYFIFIILSTLRLDFRLTFFTGLFAAAGFFSISMILIKQSGLYKQDEVLSNEYVVAAARSMVLLLSGVGAAFVARQIRVSIDRSLAAAEAGNKIVSMFGQQISKEIVDEMLESEGSLQSKLMKVCVMFIDIRNFTNQVASKTPAEIAAFQNTFFEIVIDAVTKHKGIINQFLGDGCMVTFGAPVSLQNPSRHAVNAAIEIHHALNDKVKKGDIPPTNIGIGIHTGEAVTGNIGTAERQQYSVTGTVVILASRIEQLNKDYYSRILISEDVKHALNSEQPLDAEYLGVVELKGWQQPIGIYKVA